VKKEEIVYSPFTNGEEYEISNLVKKVYDTFVAEESTAEGNNFFYEWISPAEISERQNEKNSIIVAKYTNKIVGMIEIRDTNKISLLFVDTMFQKRGIARTLFETSEEICKKESPETAFFFVNSSIYSAPIYKKLGFKETGSLQHSNGISFVPMKKSII